MLLSVQFHGNKGSIAFFKNNTIIVIIISIISIIALFFIISIIALLILLVVVLLLSLLLLLLLLLISWIRAKISFSIIRSALLCLRGTRTFRNRKYDVKEVDLDIETKVAKIYWTLDFNSNGFIPRRFYNF